MTKRQAERLEHYPEMKLRLERHHHESEQQAQRLEDILRRNDADTSSLKGAVTAVMGNVAAMLHMPASDEVLKNTFANFAFEHQEIAAYISLIAMADHVGDGLAIPVLRQSLAEEQAMADWIAGQIVPTTQRFMQLTGEASTAGV
jgi:ferritin-like metal-binding protein YciE